MLFSICIYSLGPEPLWANPAGGTVVAGSATISANGNTLTINQSTNRAIINWQSFSINSGELTKFIQPSAASASLSRVIGNNPSALLGALQSNGQVYLINPNGIVFGQGFQLNTAGFLASTLDVNNTDFMAGGNLNFTGNSAAGITNNGSLTATDGDVFLFARSVTNNGTIKASGTVGLAAGSDILLAPAGQQRVFIQAGSQPGTVVNKGTVTAVAAELKAVGGNAGALAINNTGTVRATGVANVGGHIYLTAVNGDISNSGTLVAQDAQGNGGTIQVQATSTTPAVTPATVTNSGTINASGVATGASVGGSVVVTGDNVHLTSTSVVNVSGNAGGGTAEIGGGSHGTDASVYDAQTTTVDPGSQILADALLTGNGGKVVIWSDNDTTFNGSISAQALGASGNGGSAEVSGGNLTVTGQVDLASAHGDFGNLLIDPGEVIIENGASGASTADTVTDGYIDAELLLGNLTISTANATGANGANLDIDFVNDGTPVSITVPAATSLELDAGNNINLGYAAGPAANGSISGAGTLLLYAGNSVTQNTANGDVGLAVANLGVSVGTTTAAGTISLPDVAGNAGNLNFAASTAGGSVTVNDATPGDTLTVGTVNGAAGLFGTTSGVSSSGGSIAITAPSIAVAQSVDVGVAESYVALTSTGGVTESGGATITASTLYLEGGGTSTLNDANDLNGISTGGTYDGSFSFSNGANNLNIGDGAGNGVITNGGTVTLTTTGSMTDVDGLNSAGGNVTLQSDGLTLTDTVTVGAGTLILDSSGAVTETGGNSGSGLVLDGAGGVTLNAGTDNFTHLTIAAPGGATPTVTYAGTTVPSFTVTETNNGGIVFADGQSASDSAAGSSLRLNAGPDGVAFGTTGGASGTINFPTLIINSVGAVTEGGTGETLEGTNLALLGPGPFTLTNAVNSFTTLAANTTGGINYTNAGALTIGTVGPTTGITTAAANSVTLTTESGGITLTGALNTTATGTVTLDNAGTVTGAGLITSGTLNLDGAGAIGTGTAGRVNTAVGTLAVTPGTGNVYINQTGALDLTGTGNAAVGAGATTLDLLGSAGLTFTGMVNLTPGSDAVLRFTGGAIIGQGGGTTDLSFGPGATTAFSGAGTVELLAGTGISNFQDAGTGITLAFNNTSGNVGITSYGGSTGTKIADTANVTTIASGGSISVEGGSPLNVTSSMTGASIALFTLDDQANNDIDIGPTGAVTLDATGPGAVGTVAIQSGNSVNVDNGSTIEGTGNILIQAQYDQSGTGGSNNDGLGNISLGTGTVSSSGGSVALQISNTSAPLATTVATITQTGGAIDASTGLQIIGQAVDGTTVTLTAGTNAVGTIAINANGSVSYTDADALTVGSVTGLTGTATGTVPGTTTGVTLTSTANTAPADLALTSGGLLTVASSILNGSTGNATTTLTGAYIAVANNISALNGGAISLTASGAANPGGGAGGPIPNTYYANSASAGVLIENGAEVYATDGGNISITTTSTTGADVIVANGSQVETLGAGTGGITLNSSDDVVVDGLNGTTEGVISTVNGNISITADNDLVDPADNANGVLIEAGNDPDGILVSANGTLTITSTLTNAAVPAANDGELVILGGSVAGSFVNVTSTGIQTVTVAGGPATVVPPAGPDPIGVFISGGTGSGSYAALQTTTVGATQTITANSGDIDVQGGGEKTTTGAYAEIVAGSTQQINAAGNLNVYGSDNTAPGDRVTALSNNDYGLVYTPATQTLTITGGVVLNAYQGTSTATPGDIASFGAAIVAGNTQQITTTSGGLEAFGGTLAGAAAVIDEVANPNTAASQTLTLAGINGDGLGIELKGGTAANAEAIVYSANTQTVTTTGPGILVNGYQAGSSNPPTPSFGALTSLGAGFVAGNNQEVESNAATGQLELEGGTVAGSAAVIYETAGANAAATQTVNSSGSSGISLQGGSSAVTGNEALIYTAAITGSQTVTSPDGNLTLDGNSATSTFSATTSESTPYQYTAGAGILANDAQTITVGNASPGDIVLQGGSSAGSGAIIAMLSTAATQTLTAGNGTLGSTEVGNITLTGGTGTGSAGGIVSYGIDGLAGDAQTVTAYGNISLLGGQSATAINRAPAFIDLFANQTANENVVNPGSPGTESINAGNGNLNGYISLIGGESTTATSPGNWAYISSSGAQTITAQGASPAGIPGNPFGSNTLGLGLAGGGGNYDYALVHSDGTQLITIVNGDVQVLGGNPATNPGNDLAAIFTTGADLAPQTIAVENGNLIVNGEGANLNVSAIDNETQYYIGSASVDSSGAQLITVRGTAPANGNITVQGGTGQFAAANIESLNTQTIGTSLTTTPASNLPVSGTISVLAGGKAGGVITGDYAGISSVLAQNINVTGDLIVEGSTTATANANDDYAAVVSQETQNITVGGYMDVFAESGSSNNNAGPLQLAGIPSTGVGAWVAALNLEPPTGGSENITVNGGNLSVAGGSNGVGNTAAGIEQVDTTSLQDVTVSDGSILVTGGQDNNGYAVIESNDTQDVNLTGSGNVIVQGGGTGVNLAHAAPTTGAYAAITATSSQNLQLTPAGDNLEVYGGNPATPLPIADVNNNDYAAVLTGADQTLVVGGAMTVNAYQGSSTATLGPLNGTAYSGVKAVGAIVMAEVNGTGANSQTITVNGGNLTVQGGSTGIGTAVAGTGALIEEAANNSVNDLQDITVSDGSVLVTGGQDNNGYANIESQKTQDINLTGSGNIVVQGGGTGANLAHAVATKGAYAALTSWFSQDLQLTPAGDSLEVYGSNPATPLPAADSGNDDYAAVLSHATQTIVAGGVMTVNAYQGSSTATLGPLSNPATYTGATAVGAIVIALNQQTNGSQHITVNGGNLTVEGGNTGVGTAAGGTGAVIDQADPNSDQDIEVPNAGDSVLVYGGIDTNGYALINSRDTQELGSTHPISGNVVVESQVVGTGANTGGYAAVTSSLAQTIDATGSLDVFGTQSASAVTLNDDYALVQSGANTQTLTVGNNLDIDAYNGSSVGPGGVGPLATAPAGLGAAVIANNNQNIEVGTVTGTGILTVLGGTLAGAGASLQMNGAADTQQIDVYGASATTGDSVDVLGGTGGNAYASITSNGNQELGYNFNNIKPSYAPIEGNVIVRAGTGGLTGGATATIQSSSGGDYYQEVYANGSIQVLADTAGTVGGETAGIIAYGYQDIESYGGTGISVIGGSQSGDTAVIETHNTFGDNQQEILANGSNNNLATANITVTGGAGANATAGIVDDNSDGATGDNQDIESYGTTGITVTAGSGAGSTASLNFVPAQGGQYIQAHNTGGVTLQDGNGGNAIINSGSASYTPVAQEQWVEAGGNITLTANHGNEAEITGAKIQTIISDNGALNMTGTGGAEALITAVNSTLTMGGGGASTWTGDSVIGTEAVTNYVKLINTGAITLVNPPAIEVYADEGAGEIEFDGTGTVGSTSQMLNTKTQTMQFDQGGESVYANENTDAVALQGTVGTLDLTTTGTTDGIDAVTNGAGPLTAAKVAITTSAGNINLNNPANDVAAFGNFVGGVDAVNAQGASSSFTYDGADNVALDGAVNATGAVTVDAGPGNTITLGDGLTALDPSTVTSGTTQTYGNINGNNVSLAANSTLTAGAPADPITFDGTVTAGAGGSNSPAFGSLTIANGDAIFNAGAGTLASPLYDLVLTAGANAGFTAGAAPGTVFPTVPALVLNDSFLNTSTGVVTISPANGNGAILVVDDGTVGPGPGIFMGGNMDIVAGPSPTFYVGATGSFSGTQNGGAALPTNNVYSAWTGGPAINLLIPYAPNAIFYKAPAPIPVQVHQHLLSFLFAEFTTFSLSNVSNGFYFGYQLGGDADNSAAGENGGGGFEEINAVLNPGTLAGTQQYPFVSVIDVEGYGPGSDDDGGEVWIGSGPGYLTFGSSDELRAGSDAMLFPFDEKHFPKKLEHKPISGVVPQVGSSGPDR